MTEQSLNLLKRIADQLAITIHGAHRCRRLGKAALDQHRQHVDRKGMPELMGADPDRDAGIRAAAARPREDRFPRVGEHRLPDLGQPEHRCFAGRSVVIANDEPGAFIRCDDLHVHRATANEMQCARPE